jgi:hypothetical protein
MQRIVPVAKPETRIPTPAFLERLGIVLYTNQFVIEEALRLCMERYPVAKISRYEKALDDIRQATKQKPLTTEEGTCL